MTATEPAPPDAKLMENISAAIFKLSIETRKSARSSEPTTPGDSPQSLDPELRDWLSDTLGGTASDPKVYVKLLVSNSVAGSIIGKAGNNINDLQSKTHARIQLSKSQEYYPGTRDRTLLVSGRVKQVIAALYLVLDKLVKEGVAPWSPRSRTPGREESEALVEPRLLLRLLVPQALCGIIIGKGGATIRTISADTATTIRVTHGDSTASSLAHRVVALSGTVSGVLRATALLVLKQSEDAHFALFSDLNSAYACSPASVMSSAPYLSGSPPQYPMDPPGPETSPAPRYHAGLPPRQPPGAGDWGGAAQYRGQYTSFVLAVAQEQAAALSHGGYALLNHMSNLSGARLRMEHGYHRVPGLGGRYRMLTVSGAATATQHAHSLLLGQLQAISPGYAASDPGAAWAHTVAGCTYYATPAPVGYGGPGQQHCAPHSHGASWEGGDAPVAPAVVGSCSGESSTGTGLPSPVDEA